MASLALLEQILGPEPTRALLDARGGQLVYLPQQVAPGHWLAEAIGLGLANQLCAEIGGENHDLPVGMVYQAAERHRRALDLLDQGLSLNAVAAEMGVSRTAVKDWSKRLPNENQTTFDDFLE